MATIREKILSEIGRDEGLEIERTTYENGIRHYVQGHPYPVKGSPTPEAIWAVNRVKRLCVESMKTFGPLLLLAPRKRLIGAFTRLGGDLLEPCFLNYSLLTNTAQGVFEFTNALVGNPITARIVAHVFEYDGAYRFRLMDLASETNRERLLKNPRKEIARLIGINKKRDYQNVSKKIAWAGRILSLAILWPPFRSKFKRALKKTDFKKLQFDETDTYWAYYKKDYNYFGKTYAQRQTLSALRR